jgi:hypothetical protein
MSLCLRRRRGRPRQTQHSELLKSYEHYAALYPNPDLVSETVERDKLIRAARLARRAAAAAEVSQADGGEGRQGGGSGGGWLWPWKWRLFSSSRGGGNSIIAGGGAVKDFEEEEQEIERTMLEYYYDEAYDDEKDPRGLDPSCIPGEAAAWARHLWACRARSRSGVFAVAAASATTTTTTTTTNDNDGGSSSNNNNTVMVSITGLGCVAELRPAARAATNSDSSSSTSTAQGCWEHQHTSDREQLLADWGARRRRMRRISHKEVDGPSREDDEEEEEWDPGLARAACVESYNLLVVSWGLPGDPTLVLYRKVGEQGKSSWQALAVVGPSEAVRASHAHETLFDHGGSGDDEEDEGTNRLLAVTDILPLAVADSPQSSSSQQSPTKTAAVLLAVSRLGGTLELVPVPAEYTAAAETDRDKSGLRRSSAAAAANRSPRGVTGSLRSSRPGSRHVSLPNLSDRPSVASRIVALTVREYHVDATCLEAFPVRASFTRPRQKHQFLLAAAGRGSHDSSRAEVVSFWAVTVSTVPGSSQQDSVQEVDVAFLDALRLGKVGPDATSFASPMIYRNWRRPRRVRLCYDHREDDQMAVSASSSSTAECAFPASFAAPTGLPSEPITTLSTPAPVTSFRFHAARDGKDDYALLAAVLDANGGLQVLDCTALLRRGHFSDARRTGPHGEYGGSFPPVDQDSSTPSVTIIESRPQMSRRVSLQDATTQSRARDSSSSFCTPPHIVDACWCSSRLNPDPTGPALLALTVAGHPSSQLLLLPVPSGSDETLSAPLFGIVPLPSLFSPFSLHSIRDGRVLALGQSSDQGKYETLALDRLDPRSLVQSLVLQSKYREAIVTARRLPDSEQAIVADVVEVASLKEWRRTLDVQWLEAIQDAEVVIGEALSLDAERLESMLETEVGLALFRQVHMMALQRARDIASSTSLQLRQRVIRQGTYTLLCQYFSVQPSLRQFFEQFLLFDVVKIAISLARAQDLAGLSILRFRHWPDFTLSSDTILSNIPLSVDPYYYHHLLPSCLTGSFVWCQGEKATLCDLAEYPAHILDRFGTDTILDDVDYRLILDNPEPTIVDVETFRNWYDHRLWGIQSFGQSLDESITFAVCALVAMNDHNSKALTSKSLQWKRTLSRTRAMRKALLELSESARTSGIDWALDFESLQDEGLQDLLQKLFLVVHDPMRLRVLYLEVFLPLLESLSPMPSMNDMDELFNSLCRRWIDEASQDDFQGALRTCSLVCHFSRGSLAKKERWIKSIECLDETARSILSRALAKVQESRLQPTSLREALNDCWTLYESLPVLIPGVDDEIDANARKANDSIFEKLVVMDILFSWCGSSVIPPHATPETKAREIFAVLAKALSSQLPLILEKVLESDAKMLLSVLGSDIAALKALRCFDGVDIGGIGTHSLVLELIKSAKIEVLSVLLSTPSFDWVQTQVIVDELLSFVSEVVESNWADRRALSTATACRELFGRFFPDELHSVRKAWRYLEAADFIQNIMLRDTSAKITPDVLRKQSPLDAIDMLLAEHPGLIVCDCGEWAEPGYANEANKSGWKASRRYEALDRASPVQEFPQSAVMPGEAILHLSKLLGIENESALHAVLCLAVSHGLSAQLYGACACICLRAMENTRAAADENTVAATTEMVASVVFIEEYDDVETKRELCNRCLAWATKARRQTFSSADRLVGFVSSVEFQRLLDPNAKPRAASQHLRLVERLCSDTAVAFPGTSLPLLFQTLQGQVSRGSVDSSLLFALSKFVFYWAISQCTTPKPYIVTGVEESFFREIVAIASSLLLHVPEAHLTSEALDELLSLLDSQIAASGATCQSAPLAHQTPSRDLVRRLQDRGYSQFGARRALAMTGNTSFEAALQWAVLHCLDDDFDHPIVILKPLKPRLIESSGIAYLKKLFAVSGHLVSDPGRVVRQRTWTTIPVLPGGSAALEHASHVDRPRRNSTSAGPRLASVHATDPHDVDEKASAQPIAKLLPQRHKSNDALKHEAAAGSARPPHPSATFSVTSAPNNLQISNGEPSPAADAAAKDQDLLKIESPRGFTATQKTHILPPKLDISHVRNAPNADSRPSTAESRRATRSLATGSTEPAISVNLSTSSRSDLLKRGQAALHGARKASSPDSEERRRLIEAGRKLLMSVRSSRGAVSSTSHERYRPLLSDKHSLHTGASVSTSYQRIASSPGVETSISKAPSSRAAESQLEAGSAPLHAGVASSVSARSPTEGVDSQGWELDDVETNDLNADAAQLRSPSLQEARPGDPVISGDWDFDDDFDLT